MRSLKIIGLSACSCMLCLQQASAQLPQVAVQFQGRDQYAAADASGNQPPENPLLQNITAGVVPQQNWNPIDNQYGFIVANAGTTGGLWDSNLNPTSVTLTFEGNDSWDNDVNPTNLTTGNALMMNGIIKSSASGGVPATFEFDNVPEGQYDLYVYMDMNGDNTIAKVWDADTINTFYIREQHQFYDTNSFVQSTATNVADATNIANYVKFSNLGTYGRGKIGVLAQWVSGNDGIGISGLELVPAGAAQANTVPISILTQPGNRRVLAGDTNVTFSVTSRGPVFTYQWLTNGVPVPGETNSSILALPIVSTDNGTAYSVVLSNNVNSITSSNAIVTVGHLVSVPGIQEKLWFGATLAGVEEGDQDSITPDVQLLLGTFGSPSGQGNAYTERLNCLFKPAVTTNYTFFVTSDDNSDLFISMDATPAGKTMIAQEIDWSNPLSWVGDDGGGGAIAMSQKRSDQWTNSAGETPFAGGIPLVAGNSYYLEAVHNQGTGGDKVDVTFKFVGEPDPVNGDPSRITTFLTAPFPQALDGGYIVVTNPPQNVTGIQSLTATLTIGATSGYIADASGAGPALAYQWQSAPPGSSTFTNIIGANGTSYTTPILKLSDTGNQYRVAILAGDASTNSDIGVLTVNPDTIPPRPVTVTHVSADGRTVTLTFDALMDGASSQNPAGYTINPGNIAATNASLDPDGVTVTVMTGTALSPGVTNVLTISGAKDLAGNLPAANTTISFSYQVVTYQADIEFDQPIAYYRFEEAAGTATAANNGSRGGDGAYYSGDETSPGSGGSPSSASGDAGPRPPLFAGFPADNHSATFDGTNRWVDTKNQFLQGLSAFTLEYWVAPTNRANFPARIGLVGQNDAIEYGFIDPNTIQIWTPNGGMLNTTYTNADSEWHHIATIADGTSLKTYYDGKLVGTGGTALTGTAGYGTSAFNVHIGGGGVFDTVGNYFQGNIDEVAIFDKAIPAARVAEHFSAGKSGGVITTSGAVTPGLPGTGPTLTFVQSGTTLTISWSPAGGTLQSSTALNGAATVWTDAGSTNPANIIIGAGSSFYRVKP